MFGTFGKNGLKNAKYWGRKGPVAEVRWSEFSLFTWTNQIRFNVQICNLCG